MKNLIPFNGVEIDRIPHASLDGNHRSESPRRTEAKIVSIMQPYFFPYLGYFQLIAQSDIFVFYDDVQFIKRGWVHRNRILRDGQACWVTLPVVRVREHYNFAINERRYRLDPADISRLLRQIETAYRKAPRFREIFPLMQEIMEFRNANIAAFNVNLISRIAAHLGLRARLLLSSDICKDEQLIGQDRIIDICKRLGATRYVNAVGGARLYQAERFEHEGLDLRFLEVGTSVYPEHKQGGLPFLSIIHTLMFSSVEVVAGMLNDCRLVRFDGLCS
jgi:hypothetical protein